MAVRMLRAERQEMDGMKRDKTFAHWLPVLRVVHEGDANAPSPPRVWRETDWMFSRLKSVDDLREEELELVCDELLERYKNEHYVTIILTVFATRLSNAFESAEHMETHRYWHLMQTLDGMLRGKWLASRLLDAYFGKDTDARGEKVVIPVEDELSKAENVELVDKKEELNNNKDMEINIHDNQNVVVSDKPVTINQTNNYYGTNDAKVGTAAQRVNVEGGEEKGDDKDTPEEVEEAKDEDTPLPNRKQQASVDSLWIDEVKVDKMIELFEGFGITDKVYWRVVYQVVFELGLLKNPKQISFISWLNKYMKRDVKVTNFKSFPKELKSMPSIKWNEVSIMKSPQTSTIYFNLAKEVREKLVEIDYSTGKHSIKMEYVTCYKEVFLLKK